MKKYLTKYELRWAVIITILSLLWNAFEYEMGWHDNGIASHKYYTFLFLIILTLCYYLFYLDKRANRYKKRFKFRHGFYSGLSLTILVALFSIPAQLLVHKLITPDYIDHAKDYAVQSGEMSSQQANNRFNITNFVLFFPIVYMIYGVVASFVLSLLLRKKSKRRRK